MSRTTPDAKASSRAIRACDCFFLVRNPRDLAIYFANMQRIVRSHDSTVRDAAYPWSSVLWTGTPAPAPIPTPNPLQHARQIIPVPDEPPLCDPDLENQMLLALMDVTDTSSSLSTTPAPVTISLTEQMRYLEDHIDNMDKETKTDIGRMVVDGGHKHKLAWCAIGTIMNMDEIPPDIITQMYTLVHHIRKKSESIIISETQ